LGTGRGARHRAEKDLNLDLLQIPLLEFHHLIESLPPNRLFAGIKALVLALDDCLADGTLAFSVTFNAGFQRHVEQDQSGGNLELPGDVEQVSPGLGGQRRRVHHAQAVQCKPLFYKEMHQGKGLGIESLVTLVVAHQGAGPVRRDDLGGPKVPLGKGGLPTSRRAAKDYNRRSEEAE